MKLSSKASIIYYGIVILSSLTIIYLLLNWLNWPIVASAGLGLALFLHSIIAARYFKDLSLKAIQNGITDEIAEQLKMVFTITNSGKSETEI
jgi:uncharacterized membrane protein